MSLGLDVTLHQEEGKKRPKRGGLYIHEEATRDPLADRAAEREDEPDFAPVGDNTDM